MTTKKDVLSTIIKYLMPTSYSQNIVSSSNGIAVIDAVENPNPTGDFIRGLLTDSNTIRKGYGFKEFEYELTIEANNDEVLDVAIKELEDFSYNHTLGNHIDPSNVETLLTTAISQQLSISSVSSTENIIRFGSSGAFGYANAMGNVSESIYYRNAIIFPIKKGIKFLEFTGKYGSQINTVNERTFEVKIGYVPYLSIGEYGGDQSYFDAILSNTQIYTFNKTFTTGVKYDLNFEKEFATDENTNNYGYGVIIFQDVSATYETQPMYLRDSLTVDYYDYYDYLDANLDEISSSLVPFFIEIFEKERSNVDNSALLQIIVRYEQ
jgi:hypothetical protein